jgi:hypothetical protein
MVSEGSARENSANKPELPKYRTVGEWMEKESTKRLKEAFKRLSLEESLTKNTKRV